MEKDGEKIQLGTPEQMRQIALMLILSGARPRPRRPQEASSSSADRWSGSTTFTDRPFDVTGGLFGGMSG